MKKGYLKLIIAVEFLGVAVQAMAFYDAYSDASAFVERPGPMEDSRDVRLYVSGAGHEGEVELSVMPEAPDEKEIEDLLSRAKAEIDSSFPGDNVSVEAVWKRLDIRSSYADELVDAAWEFYPEGIVDAAGNIDCEKYGDRETVTAQCTLEAYGQSEEYSFPFVVVQPDMGTMDGFMCQVERALDETNLSNDTGKLTLPAKLLGESLIWRKPVEYKGLLICLIGAVTGVALYFGQGIDERKEAGKLREEYGREYADIVENLSLYVGAGISVRGAFEKMEGQYIRWKEKHPGRIKRSYENLILMNRSIRDGMLEGEAYESFGRACIHPAYRKLSILLTQNLKRGNDRLLEQLSHEEQQVFDDRRRAIKSGGELISTKLLIPMGGLLMMILIVLIIPAMRSISL